MARGKWKDSRAMTIIGLGRFLVGPPMRVRVIESVKVSGSQVSHDSIAFDSCIYTHLRRPLSLALYTFTIQSISIPSHQAMGRLSPTA
jgi:hypothetical protein